MRRATGCATLLHRYLPSLITLLVVISALLAMNGSLWSLYRRSPPYDEIAHGVTTMALALTVTWYVFRPVLDALRSRRWLLAATVFIAGLSLGAGWEVIEYCFILPEEKMTLQDTIIDLVVDGAGAALGGTLAIVIRTET